MSKSTFLSTEISFTRVDNEAYLSDFFPQGNMDAIIYPCRSEMKIR